MVENCRTTVLHSRIDYQPLLLLDDIMSELDESSKAMVLSLLENYQVVLTTADGDLATALRQRKSAESIN